MPDDSKTNFEARVSNTREPASADKTTIPDHANESVSKPPGRYVGFDFGEKRIGLAIGQTETRQASPLSTVRNINGRPEWDKIDEVVAEWLPVGLVVGIPLTEDGCQQRQSELSSAFARRLNRRYSLPVFRCDERFSSIVASGILAENRRLGQRRRKLRRTDTDKTAAAVILQRWLSGSLAS